MLVYQRVVSKANLQKYCWPRCDAGDAEAPEVGASKKSHLLAARTWHHQPTNFLEKRDISIHIHTYIHTHIHTYIYIYIHIYIVVTTL